MNKKTLITIACSLAAGIIAVVLVNVYIAKQERSIFAGMALVDVIAVTQDVPAGARISADLLAKKKVPEKYVHGNAVSPEDANLVIGQALNFPLKAGDPVLWTDLQEESRKMGSSLAGRITKGERALAIAVDSVSGVSGHLRPNDHIDILGTFRSEKTGEEATLTLLQNITILATGDVLTGDTFGRRDTEYTTLTLLVTLEEAELLVFAKTKGKLAAILRNSDDIETLKEIPKVTFENIMKTEYRKKIQIKRDSIQVIKSGKISR